MKAKPAWAVVFGVVGVLAACERPGNNDLLKGQEDLGSARTDVPAAPPPPVASSKPAASSSSSAPPATSASASGSASAAAAGSAAKPPAKEYECGSKGKPDCPMQRWMKSVAGGAAMSGDAGRLRQAFLAMSRSPPGMGAWASMCATGAAKAAEGDVDAAKQMCKACHGKYQASYRANYRDMAWPLALPPLPKAKPNKSKIASSLSQSA